MATVTLDVFDSPAVAILCALEHDGFTVQLEPDNGIVIVPRSRLTPERMAEITRYKDALGVVLRCCDAGVQERRDAFRQQLEASPAPRVPAFVFRPGIAYAPGSCFSCGDALPAAKFGRCWRCSLAWRLACRLPIDAALGDALDRAKRIA